MLPRGLKFVLLLLIPALLSSSQCYANCRNLSAAPASHAHCHQHTPTQAPSQQDCHHHQTSEFSNPEQAFELTHIAASTHIFALPVVLTTFANTAPSYAIRLIGAAPPCPTPAQSVSVLRV